MNFGRQIQEVTAAIERANRIIKTFIDASKSIGALIYAITHLVVVIEEQQRRIERLENLGDATASKRKTFK